ncbi:GNAT family N-acetyltransferase [Parasedimentitalea huanghaiensis]|uniref:GNAT family N-acetyltransferase n=1 Tax=Parasedimentitalea huanghaiensis TaxID=2682100 RepID=A0A6L6WIY1_9RHOB|nr:GNAT family N-acetyltransferase [Zongyanglinia huanghaiensis]MVO17138.1 GNAT family N-acetyltransferase [Zongyanglinia huanghaiensis]
MPEFTIALAPTGDPDAARLIQRHLALMTSQSPAESCHAQGQSDLEAPGARLFLLRQDGVAIAMGALKSLDNGALELKSMHTVSEARGSGAGRAMLTHLVTLARNEAATGVFLETGSAEEFRPSRQLYATLGFVECPPFSNYEEDPLSTFMYLDLSSAS